MVYWADSPPHVHIRHDVSLIRLRPRTVTLLTTLALSIISSQRVSATHHLQHPPLHLVSRQNSDLPLTITNNCEETIYPAILTQGGTGPDQSGFRLDPGGSISQNVSETWRGRVWGRTNCTFDEDGNVPSSGQGGTACLTGDCGAFVECPGAVGLMTVHDEANMKKLTLILGQPSRNIGRVHICLILNTIILRHLTGRWIQPASRHHLPAW